jgi:hypothetical protein
MSQHKRKRAGDSESSSESDEGGAGGASTSSSSLDGGAAALNLSMWSAVEAGDLLAAKAAHAQGACAEL